MRIDDNNVSMPRWRQFSLQSITTSQSFRLDDAFIFTPNIRLKFVVEAVEADEIIYRHGVSYEVLAGGNVAVMFSGGVVYLKTEYDEETGTLTLDCEQGYTLYFSSFFYADGALLWPAPDGMVDQTWPLDNYGTDWLAGNSLYSVPMNIESIPNPTGPAIYWAARLTNNSKQRAFFNPALSTGSFIEPGAAVVLPYNTNYTGSIQLDALQVYLNIQSARNMNTVPLGCITITAARSAGYSTYSYNLEVLAAPNNGGA